MIFSTIRVVLYSVAISLSFLTKMSQLKIRQSEVVSLSYSQNKELQEVKLTFLSPIKFRQRLINFENLNMLLASDTLPFYFDDLTYFFPFVLFSNESLTMAT